MSRDRPLSIRIFHLDMDGLVEKAFARASEVAEKERVVGLKPIVKARIKEKVRLKIASSHITRSLGRLHKSIPPGSEISPFYGDLLEVLGAGSLQDARRAVGKTIAGIRRPCHQCM